jgi:hypothetical protein
MRFMTMVKASENSALGPPPPALMQAIGELGEEARKAGVMLQMGGLLPSAMGARLELRDGKLSVTDGPFSEAKEVIGGYAVYSVKTKQEAIDWARRFMTLHQRHWPGWQGETELRQLMEMPGCAAEA